MTATSRAPRRPRIIRARGPRPAPTPIRTARGTRSAAADERVLAEFLEASLRVPDLALPPRKRFSFPPAPPPAAPPEVSARALLIMTPGDAAHAELPSSVIGAAAESGAFRMAGAVEAREVSEALEASRVVFAAPEEVKRELGKWFRGRDRPAGEEFCWFRPATPEDDRMLDAALPGSTYRVFREKMDTVASKMEDIAKTVIRVLSENAKNPKDCAFSGEAPSILCLTLYNRNVSKTRWNESGSGSTGPPRSHALSIHLSGRDRQICLRNQSGSAIFTLPAGSMLVTIGKQIQDWSNGKFKSAVGEVLFEMTDEPDPFISLELLYSPDDLHLSEVGRHARYIDRPKIVSFRDQIQIVLVLLSLFYLLWR